MNKLKKLSKLFVFSLVITACSDTVWLTTDVESSTSGKQTSTTELSNSSTSSDIESTQSKMTDNSSSEISSSSEIITDSSSQENCSLIATDPQDCDEGFVCIGTELDNTGFCAKPCIFLTCAQDDPCCKNAGTCIKWTDFSKPPLMEGFGVCL